MNQLERREKILASITYQLSEIIESTPQCDDLSSIIAKQIKLGNIEYLKIDYSELDKED